jgi:hypothetical protein
MFAVMTAEELIGPNGVWAKNNCTRILVSSSPSLQMCQGATSILLVDRGTVKAEGSYDTLKQKGVLDHFLFHDPDGEEQTEDTANDSTTKLRNNLAHLKEKENNSSSSGILVTAEDRETGIVKLDVLVKFLSAAGWKGVASILSFYVAGASLFLGQSIWLAAWTESNDADTAFYLSVYASFAFGVLGFALLRYISCAHLAFNASKDLHHKMVLSVIEAPLAFFDVTPCGRIMNRFSRDCRSLDLDVWQQISSFLDLFFGAFTPIGYVVVTMPLFAIILLPLGLVFLRLQKFYRASSREMKRLLAISRTPLVQCFVCCCGWRMLQ